VTTYFSLSLQTSTSLLTPTPTCPLLSKPPHSHPPPKYIIHLLSSPPAPNPKSACPCAARCRVGSSTAQGRSTSPTAHHYPRLPIACPPLDPLPANPCLTSAPRQGAQLHSPPQYQLRGPFHSPPPAQIVSEDAGAASASPTAARRQLRVAESLIHTPFADSAPQRLHARVLIPWRSLSRTRK
jgi:hypothetical protein